MKRVSLIAIPHPEHPQLFLHGLRTDSGRWSLPGGHCHDGETPEEGARRELFEETGITPIDIKLVWRERLPTTDDPDGVQIYLFETQYNGESPEPTNDPDKEFVTYKWLDPAIHPNMIVTKDSNALVHYVYDKLGLDKREVYDKLGLDKRELEKGVMRRKAKFNPIHDIPTQEHKTIDRWQEFANPEDEDESGHPSDYRAAISPMHPAARQRAIHKLSTLTQTRRNPHTNEMEFLLHRGMSPDEHNITTGKYRVNSSMKTSWTPDQSVARKFTNPKHIADFSAERYSWDPHIHGPGKMVSAWIPESKIHHMPMMYGSASTRPKKVHKPNNLRDEQEIIVKPGHDSEIAVPGMNIPETPTIHQTISNASPNRILGEQIARQGYRQSMQRALESLPPDKQSAVKQKLKLSEPMAILEILEKALAPDPKGPGIKHPFIPNLVSRPHPGVSSGYAWHYDVPSQRHVNQEIDDRTPGFLQRIQSPVHRKILDQAISNVIASPTKHFRLGWDKNPQNQVLRARHVLSLLSGQDSAKMDLSDPNSVKLTLDRHREGKPGEKTTWTLDHQGGHQQGTAHYDLQRSDAEELLGGSSGRAGQGMLGPGCSPDDQGSICDAGHELRVGCAGRDLRGVSGAIGPSRDSASSSPLGKSEELDKSSKLDIRTVPDDRPHVMRVRAFKRGKVIGEAVVTHADESHLEPEDLWVHEKHRRQGVASAMYEHAEKTTGKKLKRIRDLESPNARSLWNNPNRKFGLNKSEDLQKMGAMRRLFPFNPSKVPADERHPVEDWTGGYANDPTATRSDIPVMSPEAKQRGFNKLLQLTQSRRNPVNGETEILLHRGMSGLEHDHNVGKRAVYSGNDYSSWTPHIKTATNFADDYNVYPDRGFVSSRVVSAWVPLSHIHHIPFQIGSTARDYDSPADTERVPGKHLRHREHEVIVGPQRQLHIHTQNVLPLASTTPKKLAASELDLQSETLPESLEKMHVIRLPGFGVGTRPDQQISPIATHQQRHLKQKVAENAVVRAGFSRAGVKGAFTGPQGGATSRGMLVFPHFDAHRTKSFGNPVAGYEVTKPDSHYTREHEALHHTLAEVEAKHGSAARASVVSHLLAHLDPTNLKAIRAYTYRMQPQVERHPLGNEETLASAVDLVNSPFKRTHFHGMMADYSPNPLNMDQHKRDVRAMIATAAQLKPEDVIDRYNPKVQPSPMAASPSVAPRRST